MNIKTSIIIVLFVIAVIVLSCDEKTLEGFYGGHYYHPYYSYGYGYPYYSHGYPHYTGYHQSWYRKYVYPSYWWNSIRY